MRGDIDPKEWLPNPDTRARYRQPAVRRAQRRDVAWGVLFTLLGIGLLATAPFVNPLPFLVCGWTGLLVGAVTLARVIVDRIDP